MSSACKNNNNQKPIENEPDTVKMMPDDMALYIKLGDTLYIPNKPVEAVLAYELLNDQDTFCIELKGKIINVCKSKGCWVDVETEAGNFIQIKTQDRFFFNQSSKGKYAYFKGCLYKDIGENNIPEVVYLATAAWVHQ